MTLGERLKTRRKQLGYSQHELADLTGISQIQISRYEQDANMPTSDMIIKLSRALGVSADWLLGLTEAFSDSGLSDIEQMALAILRTKAPDRQPMILEVMRLIS